MGTNELTNTAYLIAWGRASDPNLSLDPYSYLWLTTEGIRFSGKFTERVTRFAPHFFCLRSRYIIELLKSFEQDNPCFSLVNVGSGLTSYPFIISESSTVFALDQEHVLNFYQKRVSKGVKDKILPERDIRYVPGDLNSVSGTQEFRKLLHKLQKPTVVLFEGILTYLDKDRCSELLQACSDELVTGSKVLIHVFLDTFLSSKVMDKIEMCITKELGLSMLTLTSFNIDEVETLRGFKLIEHVGFREIQERYNLKKTFSNAELIDERFFLFEKE